MHWHKECWAELLHYRSLPLHSAVDLSTLQCQLQDCPTRWQEPCQESLNASFSGVFVWLKSWTINQRRTEAFTTSLFRVLFLHDLRKKTKHSNFIFNLKFNALEQFCLEILVTLSSHANRQHNSSLFSEVLSSEADLFCAEAVNWLGWLRGNPGSSCHLPLCSAFCVLMSPGQQRQQGHPV